MQSNNLYYYSSGTLFFSKTSLSDINRPDLDLFSKIFPIFAKQMCFHDRSGIIKTPLRTVTIPGLEIPKYEIINLSFEEICNKRAIHLMDLAKKTNRKIAVMYSGGIDSTLILVTFLKMFSDQDIKNHIVVLMSSESITENPNFYYNFVIKKFTIKNSYFFKQILGNDDYMFVTGEGNDQLFGSQVLVDNPDYFGTSPADLKITDSIFVDFFSRNINRTDAEKIYHILDKTCRAAPINIENVYEWLWWINFSCKWQSVFLRSLSFISDDNMKNAKLFDNYFMFFSDPEMQLWVMNNKYLLSGDNAYQYKNIPKEIIFDYNKDTDYRDFKLKKGSLWTLFVNIPAKTLIDENLNFYDNFDTRFLNEDSDFA